MSRLYVTILTIIGVVALTCLAPKIVEGHLKDIIVPYGDALIITKVIAKNRTTGQKVVDKSDPYNLETLNYNKRDRIKITVKGVISTNVTYPQLVIDVRYDDYPDHTIEWERPTAINITKKKDGVIIKARAVMEFDRRRFVWTHVPANNQFPTSYGDIIKIKLKGRVK